MLYERHNRGQSLIEMLFAVAVFTIGVVTIGYLVFDSFTSLRFGKETMQARLLASEGLEAVRTIYEDDFALLESGTYGLALQNGVSDFYTKEVNVQARKLPTIIEPLLLIFIAVIVGFVALAIIMPIYELTGNISR